MEPPPILTREYAFCLASTHVIRKTPLDEVLRFLKDALAPYACDHPTPWHWVGHALLNDQVDYLRFDVHVHTIPLSTPQYVIDFTLLWGSPLKWHNHILPSLKDEPASPCQIFLESNDVEPFPEPLDLFPTELICRVASETPMTPSVKKRLLSELCSVGLCTHVGLSERDIRRMAALALSRFDTTYDENDQTLFLAAKAACEDNFLDRHTIHCIDLCLKRI